MLLYEVRQKGAPLSDKTFNKAAIVYRAQPATSTIIEPMSLVVLRLGFARDHAIHMANTEEVPYHVIKMFARTSEVFEAYNPKEYFYDGPSKEGKPVFKAEPGDDFPQR